MTWSKSNLYADVDGDNIICNYTDTYNILNSFTIKRFSYKTKITDFIQYIDDMLGISVTATNLFDILNIYEDDAYMDDPIKYTRYGSFVNSLYQATKTL